MGRLKRESQPQRLNPTWQEHLVGVYALCLLGLGVFNLATSWVDSRVTWLALAGGGAGFIAYVLSWVRQGAARRAAATGAVSRPKMRVAVLVRLLVEVAVVTVIGLYASVSVTSMAAFIAVVVSLILAMGIIEFTIGAWEDRRDRSGSAS